MRSGKRRSYPESDRLWHDRPQAPFLQKSPPQIDRDVTALASIALPIVIWNTMQRDILDLDPENKYRPARGRLLVSGHYLPDPYFRRTVVLLCDHNDEGTFGFVLNRHMEMNVSDLVDNLPPIGSKVSIGGPVQSGDLYYLHTLGPHIEGSQEIVDGVFMGGEYDQLRAILTTDPKLSKHV